MFCLYGFKPIETPMLCYYDLLASKYSGGAEILKEVYTLRDQGKRDLGLRYDLTIPFAKFIGIKSTLAEADEKINEVILSLDKIEKIGVEGVKEELANKEIESETIEKILKIAVDKEKRNIEYYKSNYNEKLLNEGVKELEELQEYIMVFGLENKTVFNPFLARGLDIYTGTVYEIFLEDKSMTSSIGDGGRYDKIIGEFLDEDKEYPAVGISFGLDVIFAAMSLKEKLENMSLIDIFIIPMNTEKEALKLAAST